MARPARPARSGTGAGRKPGAVAALEQRQILSRRAWRKRDRDRPDARGRPSQRSCARSGVRKTRDRRGGCEAARLGGRDRHLPDRPGRSRSGPGRGPWPADDDPALACLDHDDRRIFADPVRRRAKPLRGQAAKIRRLSGPTQFRRKHARLRPPARRTRARQSRPRPSPHPRNLRPGRPRRRQ